MANITTAQQSQTKNTIPSAIDMKVDYKAKMNEADAAGDYTSAALYEQQRNAKIDAMNKAGTNAAGHQKTYQYQSYIGQTQQSSAPKVTADDIAALYTKMQEQSDAKVDYTVNQAVAELQRAEADAQRGFQAQRNQVNIDEAQARDKQVLYAAARGDRGGITARQFDSIGNTASNNRRAIHEQQQKLASDTARQIADLRAQGEFEKANAVLQIAQQQLAQLWELQQYEDQKAMNEASLTGMYNGQKTYAAQEAEKQWAYEVAMQSIQAGIVPTTDVLSAAGLDTGTAQQMANVYKASLAAKKSSGSGGTTSNKMSLANAKLMAEEGMFSDAVLQAFADAGFTQEYLAEVYGYEAPGVASPTVEVPDNATISNKHGDSWVYVPGHGRFSYQEVLNYVESGKIIEDYDAASNTLTYRWAG